MKKKNCQIKHAQKRCAERFGINIGMEDIDKIVNAIQSSSTNIKLISRESNRVSKYKANLSAILNKEFDGQAVVLYDNDEIL